jgi:hypothetical protein
MIDIKKDNRIEVGSCNSCQKKGGRYEEVYLVELKTISFRLCRDCTKELSRKLKLMVKL